jgi:hypothetical protein
MSGESYVRNGHHVELNVAEDSTGQWTWSYTIDTDGYTEMRDRPVATRDAAAAAAKEHANAKADVLPRGEARQ